MILFEEHGRVAVGVLGDAPESLLVDVVAVRAAVVPVPVPQQRREGQQAAGRRAVAPARVLAAPAARAAHSTAAAAASQCKKWAALLMEFSARSAYSSNEAVS